MFKRIKKGFESLEKKVKKDWQSVKKTAKGLIYALHGEDYIKEKVKEKISGTGDLDVVDESDVDSDDLFVRGDDSSKASDDNVIDDTMNDPVKAGDDDKSTEESDTEYDIEDDKNVSQDEYETFDSDEEGSIETQDSQIDQSEVSHVVTDATSSVAEDVVDVENETAVGVDGVLGAIMLANMQYDEAIKARKNEQKQRIKDYLISQGISDEQADEYIEEHYVDEDDDGYGRYRGYKSDNKKQSPATGLLIGLSHAYVIAVLLGETDRYVAGDAFENFYNPTSNYFKRIVKNQASDNESLFQTISKAFIDATSSITQAKPNTNNITNSDLNFFQIIRQSIRNIDIKKYKPDSTFEQAIDSAHNIALRAKLTLKNRSIRTDDEEDWYFEGELFDRAIEQLEMQTAPQQRNT